jgi:hypothetical protein
LGCPDAELDPDARPRMCRLLFQPYDGIPHIDGRFDSVCYRCEEPSNGYALS